MYKKLFKLNRKTTQLKHEQIFRQLNKDIQMVNKIRRISTSQLLEKYKSKQQGNTTTYVLSNLDQQQTYYQLLVLVPFVLLTEIHFSWEKQNLNILTNQHPRKGHLGRQLNNILNLRNHSFIFYDYFFHCLTYICVYIFSMLQKFPMHILK